MTNSVTPLFNNTSTVIPFCILILSNLIFIITSLRAFLLKLHLDILFTTLLIIFCSSSLPYKILISIIFCNISEPSAIVVVLSLIYLHSIQIMSQYEPCLLLLQVYYNYIYSFHFFYQRRLCWCLLKPLLLYLSSNFQYI